MLTRGYDTILLYFFELEELAQRISLSALARFDDTASTANQRRLRRRAGVIDEEETNRHFVAKRSKVGRGYQGNQRDS